MHNAVDTNELSSLIYACIIYTLKRETAEYEWTNNEGNTIRKRVIISNNTKLIKSYLRIIPYYTFIIFHINKIIIIIYYEGN